MQKCLLYFYISLAEMNSCCNLQEPARVLSIMQYCGMNIEYYSVLWKEYWVLCSIVEWVLSIM